MSLIKGKNVSPEILRVAKAAIDRIPQNDLLFYAATSPAFSHGGFRKDNVAVVRSRIYAMIGGSEPVEDALKNLLAKYDECAAIVIKLSADVIKANLEHFSVAFGRAELAFALSLVPCLAELAEEADKTAESSPKSNEEDRENALQAIRAELAPLSCICGETKADFDSTRRINELKKELAALKGASKRLEKAEAGRITAEADAAKFRQRAEEAEKSEGRLRQRAERAEAELARNVREAEAHVQALLDTRVAEEFAEWLGDRRAAIVAEIAALPAEGGVIASGMAAKPCADAAPVTAKTELQARAVSAIRHQASIDLVSGTRYLLERRLADYNELYRRSVSMIADALSPNDELVAVRGELQAEIARIGKLLRPDDEVQMAVFPEELVAAAMAVASDHEIPDLVHTAWKMQGLGIISEIAAERLADAAKQRYSAIYAGRGGPGLENGDPNTAEFIFRRALEGEVALVLLVDAHNTLYALQSRYSRPQDHKGPSASARDWLVSDIVQVVSNARNCRVIMVFDGPERTESFPSGNVKVVYSGGGGNDVEHRADDVIVDEARFLAKADPDCRILLMTNDNGLSSRAASFGTRNIAPTALLEYLR